ncbi:MAG TPA: energy-coupling factor transporter transmembrane protein EcfT [Syntrophales bacterium]|nr:energy-coupling factor transporter transmembrane protein EcfT [Syntrophales bacterium]HPC00183.1 energy-coupling factor transporter transmembrane protein EcfT [Syntrophales bacterium]
MLRFGDYTPRDSLLHGLDARVKIAASAILSVVALTGGWSGLAALTIAGALSLRGAGLSFKEVLGAMKPLLFFAFLLFAMHAFFHEGRPLIDVTGAGVLAGLYTAWQYLALVAVGIFLTATTPPSELVAGLGRLLRPLERWGVPVGDISFMVAVSLRFIPLLLGEYERLRAARAARGADWEGGVAKRLGLAVGLVIPLLIGAFRRADDLAVAVEARGYGHRAPSSLRGGEMGSPDRRFLAAVASLALVVIVLHHALPLP